MTHPTRFGRALSFPLAMVALLAASSLAPAARTAVPQARPSTGELPKVFFYATGGTISNRQGPEGRLSMDELLASMPGIGRIARASGEQFSNVASGAITTQMWLDLSKSINQRFRDDDELAGVVVTSGTDTLEELAYFLHLTVRDPRPVVVVGSMRNPSTAGYEGVANLEDAFRVAAAPQAREMGTLVVLNDEINSAREATKTDARLLNTFTSRGYGVLGTVVNDVEFYRKPVKRHTANSEFRVENIETLPRVDVIWTYQEAPGDLIQAAADFGAKGIIVAGAGAGALSGTQRDGISYATDKGVVVVSTTRTGGGSVGSGGRGSTLRGGDLQPIKARILLMLALATTDDIAEIRRMLSEY